MGEARQQGLDKLIVSGVGIPLGASTGGQSAYSGSGRAPKARGMCARDFAVLGVATVFLCRAAEHSDLSPVQWPSDRPVKIVICQGLSPRIGSVA